MKRRTPLFPGRDKKTTFFFREWRNARDMRVETDVFPGGHDGLCALIEPPCDYDP